jgi:hypothetical protein
MVQWMVQATTMIRLRSVVPVVVVARDQQSLVRRRPGEHAGDEFEAVAKAGVGIGRVGVAEDAGAGPAAVGDALDELRGLFDPARVEHGAGMQEHQPGRARGPRARRHRRGAGALK